nr:transporter substrate-binding domain-containing protein [uncultured Desulfobacter sp.]
MKKNIAIYATIIWVLFTPFVYGREQNHLNINCTIHSPYEAFFFRLVEVLCSQNNIKVTRNTPPVGRSLIHVNEGVDDGDGPRIGGLSKNYPNLVQVSEPFGEFIFGAFTKNKNIRLNGWSSLMNLNVAYIHGWKIFDNKVTNAKSVTKVKNKELLFKLLHTDRTDVALVTKLSGYAVIKNLGFKEIEFIDPPLAVEPNFLYLHNSHKSLAPLLAETLRKMKQDGTYNQFYNEIISPYLPE